MRITKNGQLQRPCADASKKEPQVQYFLAFEGAKTEYQYFSGVMDKQETLGISALKDITLLRRHTLAENQSNPAKFLPLLFHSLEEYKTGSFSVQTIVEHTVDWLILKNYLPGKGSKKRQDMLETLLNNLEEDGFPADQRVTDWGEMTDALRNHLAQYYAIRISDKALKEFQTYLKRQFVTYNPRYDKACVIVDRDPESFTAAQYDQALTLCRQRNIALHVSNPCFELWLLLHFPEVLELDRDKMLKNERAGISSRRRFLENELRKILPQFRKNTLKFELFADHIQQAIENESAFCEDIEMLKIELGSNVGKLLSEMKNRSRFPEQ